jgi:hypothetical protein
VRSRGGFGQATDYGSPIAQMSPGCHPWPTNAFSDDDAFGSYYLVINPARYFSATDSNHIGNMSENTTLGQSNNCHASVTRASADLVGASQHRSESCRRSRTPSAADRGHDSFDKPKITISWCILLEFGQFMQLAYRHRPQS